MSNLNGIYKAVVVDTRDPECRGRVRVHIHGLQTFQGNTYDWAESGWTYTENHRALTRDIRELVEFADYATEGVSAKDITALPGAYPSTEDGSSSSETPVSDGLSTSESSSALVEVTSMDGFDVYPWAEVVTQSSKYLGLSHSYQVGETVWVMFEGGELSKPIVVGGWGTMSFGVADSVPDAGGAKITGDNNPIKLDANKGAELEYEFTRRKLSIQSAYGDLIQIDMTRGGQGVRLRSGEAEIKLSPHDDSLFITVAGSTVLRSGNITNVSRGNFQTAEFEYVVNVSGGSGQANTGTPGVAIPIAAMYSMGHLELYGKEQIAIGQYLMRESYAIRNPTDESLYVDKDTGERAITGVAGAWGDQSRSRMVQSRFAIMAPKILYLGISCPKQAGYYSDYRDGWNNPEASGSSVPSVSSASDDDTLNPQLWRMTEVTRVEGTRYISITANGRMDPDKSGSVVGTVIMRSIASRDETTSAGDCAPCHTFMTCDDIDYVTNPQSYYTDKAQLIPKPGSVSTRQKYDGGMVLWADGTLFIQAKDFKISPGILEISHPTFGACRRNTIHFDEGYTLEFPTPTDNVCKALVKTKRLRITASDPAVGPTENTYDIYVPRAELVV